jgi:hypothetical protein
MKKALAAAPQSPEGNRVLDEINALVEAEAPLIKRPRLLPPPPSPKMEPPPPPSPSIAGVSSEMSLSLLFDRIDNDIVQDGWYSLPPVSPRDEYHLTICTMSHCPSSTVTLTMVSPSRQSLARLWPPAYPAL